MRGKGRNSLLASCVHLYFTALSISTSMAAERLREIKREMVRERFAPGHCGLVMASLSLLKVFANIKSVCFGLKQGTSSWFFTSTYFSGYF